MTQLTIFWSAILGVVEGLTEFIPVSSTGHMILVSEAAGIHGAAAETFEVFVQLGAILAVVWLYWPRFAGLLDFSEQKSPEASFRGLTGILKLFTACLPAFLLGWLFHSVIKERLFFSASVALAMVVGGVVILLVDRPDRKSAVTSIDSLSYKQCFWIGVAQCFAMWPGMSRSAATIIGGLLAGLDRKVAAEFSFLVAVPTIAAAAGYDMLKSFSALSVSDLPSFAVGFAVSFITAVFAIKFFIGLLSKFTLRPFAVYRILAGVAVLLLVG